MANHLRRLPQPLSSEWQTYPLRRDSDAIDRMTHWLRTSTALTGRQRDVYVAGVVGYLIAQSGADVNAVLEDVAKRCEDHAARNGY